MRYSAVDTDTLAPVPNPNHLQSGQNIKYQYLPRIRCHDCPGKLYTPGPGMTVDNFEVHLRNRQHKERVDERIAKSGGTPVPRPDVSSASASPAPGAIGTPVAGASPALGAGLLPGASASGNASPSPAPPQP